MVRDATTPAVLYVDDECANRVLFEASVGEQLEVWLAHDGPSAVDVLSAKRIDAMVTDYRMPGSSGLELCRQVRERWPDLQIVMISAFAPEGLVGPSLRLGVLDAYFAKPIDFSTVVELIRARGGVSS